MLLLYHLLTRNVNSLTLYFEKIVSISHETYPYVSISFINNLSFILRIKKNGAFKSSVFRPALLPEYSYLRCSPVRGTASVKLLRLVVAYGLSAGGANKLGRIEGLVEIDFLVAVRAHHHTEIVIVRSAAAVAAFAVGAVVVVLIVILAVVIVVDVENEFLNIAEIPVSISSTAVASSPVRSMRAAISLPTAESRS